MYFYIFKLFSKLSSVVIVIKCWYCFIMLFSFFRWMLHKILFFVYHIFPSCRKYIYVSHINIRVQQSEKNYFFKAEFFGWGIFYIWYFICYLKHIEQQKIKLQIEVNWILLMLRYMCFHNFSIYRKQIFMFMQSGGIDFNNFFFFSWVFNPISFAHGT